MGPTDLSEASHPSPHRAAVGLPLLLYGLIAAPVAWICGQIASSTLAQEACFPGTQPLMSPAFNGVHFWNEAILATALMISASAAVVAFRAWSRTRHEQAGDQHTLLEVGEGRSRFMALAGIITSIGFMIATLFSMPALLVVPAC